ncbi:MAG: hypothetical protein IT328_09615 [Caldilineaceae bacterium]|nr:hypothetical protein [Caldilineaceae bacterium]
MARLLLIGIINHADDQGRIKGHPAYLRSQIFPYDDVSLEDIDAWLHLIAHNGTHVAFHVEGKVYLQLVNWWEYQSLLFAMPSDYPAPDGWQDRIRYNARGGHILTHNWRKVDGSLAPDTCDHRGNPIDPRVKRTSDNTSDTRVETPQTHLDTQVETQVENHVTYPGGGINKDQIKININKDQGRDRAHVTETPETNTHPPSLVIFQEFCTKTINSAQTDAIASAITDLELWRQVLTEWSLRGYNTGNVTGLLDWYRDGIPPAGKNGATHGSNTKRSEPDDSDDAPKLDPELQRQFAELRERKRAKAQPAT